MKQELIGVNTGKNTGWRFHSVGLANPDHCQSCSNENIFRWTDAKLGLLFKENSSKETSKGLQDQFSLPVLALSHARVTWACVPDSGTQEQEKLSGVFQQS